MGITTPAELIDAYARGMLTSHEMVVSLIQSAATFAPEAILPLVPSELMSEFQERIAHPPERPDSVRFAFMGAFTDGFDYEEWEREQQDAYYDGAWCWHRFLIAKKQA